MRFEWYLSGPSTSHNTQEKKKLFGTWAQEHQNKGAYVRFKARNWNRNGILPSYKWRYQTNVFETCAYVLSEL